ncbi:MAG: hypothetical protein GEU99_15530 [Luteitalea sp.]|nr:hypothetical protein [Luteitalea sp.]
MAKYTRTASRSVERAMRKRKKGSLRSGSGKKVASRKQGVAIGLSEARKAGASFRRSAPRPERSEQVSCSGTRHAPVGWVLLEMARGMITAGCVWPTGRAFASGAQPPR